MFRKKQLGNTDMMVTQLGYGSMGLRGPNTWGVRVVEDSQAEQVLQAVLDAGINFIDTAPDYGIAEERIGKFLASRRDEFYLATKCGCDPVQHKDHLEIRHTWKPETITRNLELSLKRLRTETIDLMQFHGGDAETLQSAGLIDLGQTWKTAGKIRYLGVSSKLPNLMPLLELDVFDVFQMPYSCLAPEHSHSMLAAAERGAGVVVRGGISNGGPDAEIQRPALNDVWSRAQLDELVPQGMLRAEFILRATLAHPACGTTIVGTCNLEHLSQNLAAAQAGALPAELTRSIHDRVAKVISPVN